MPSLYAIGPFFKEEIVMKKEIKGFVLGVLTTVVVGSGAVIAAGQS